MKNKNIGIRRKFYRSITSIMLVSFLLVTFIPIMVLCTYSYHYLAENVKEDFYNRSKQLVTGIDSNLTIYFNEIKKLTDSVFVSGTIEEILITDGQSLSESLEQYYVFQEYFSNLIGGRGDFACIYLYKQNGEYLEWNLRQMNQLQPSNEAVLEKLKESGARFVVYGPRTQTAASGYQRNIITVGRQLKSVNTGRDTGYLIIDLDYSAFQKIIGMKARQPENLIISDADRRIYYNNHKREDVGDIYPELETLLENEVSGNKKQYTEIKSNAMEWNYLMITDQEALLRKLNHVAFYLFGGGTLCFLLFFIIAYFVSQSISKPLKRLEEAMRKAESNGFNEVVPAFNTYGEVNKLTRRYNVMLVEIQRLLENEKELYRKKAESDYQALQLQITPHFLYNSLDSINCLAQVYGKNDISEMILSLADIFKYNMRYETKTVTLRDEITHVQNYCMLQAVHFQERFQIIYEVDEVYLDYQVTKFMLQPLVENAISYGVSRLKSGGWIKISAEETDRELIVSVTDNGKGMGEDVQQQLCELFNLSIEELIHGKGDNTHVGLYNVNLRLKLQYGELAGITFKSVPDKETRVNIHIPKRGK